MVMESIQWRFKTIWKCYFLKAGKMDQYFRLHCSVKLLFLSRYSNIISRVFGEYARSKEMMISLPFSSSEILHKKKKNHVLHQKWSSPEHIVPPLPTRQSQSGVRWLRSYPVWAFISLKWPNRKNNIAAICYQESNGGRGSAHFSDRVLKNSTLYNINLRSWIRLWLCERETDRNFADVQSNQKRGCVCV